MAEIWQQRTSLPLLYGHEPGVRVLQGNIRAGRGGEDTVSSSLHKHPAPMGWMGGGTCVRGDSYSLNSLKHIWKAVRRLQKTEIPVIKTTSSKHGKALAATQAPL